jgi:tetratricopeptide (TPR) repeat protein
MSNDWFRKTSWSKEDEADFSARLKRSRSHNRAQYIRIQAITLYETSPDFDDLAINLLDLVLRDYPDSADVVSAFEWKGKCYERRGRVVDAINCYRLSVERMRQRPSWQTWAWLDMVWLIAREAKHENYNEAWNLIQEFAEKSSVRFPVVIYKLQGSKALILAAEGKAEMAAEAAREALSAAQEQVSGLPRHPTTGLVTDTAASIEGQLRRIVGRLN